MRLFSFICFIFTCAQQVYLFKLNIQPQRNSDSSLNPVILIPGTGGTQLWANLSKPAVPHYYCEKQTKEYFNIWLNLELVVPLVISCWIDNVRLIYDKKTRKTKNQPGVDIKILDFGNTTSIDYIDPSKIRYTVYFEKIINKLEEKGYERGINLLGAPYDFRKSPAEITEFYEDFDKLIESSYNNNDKKPVILICHSMGCLMTYSHLKKKTKEWTDKFIKSFITLGSPWGGSVKSVKTIITGDNLGVSIMDTLSMREVSRTYPSVPYLFPKQGFWREDEPIVTVAFSPYKNMSFSTNDYQELLDSIQLNDVYEMYKDVSSLINDFSPPNVELHCIHGYGVKTMETLHYPQNKFPDGTPEIQYGDGDGTVNLRSLDFCKNWINRSKKPVTYKTFDKTEHMQTTSSEEVVSYIGELVFGTKYETSNEISDSTEYWDDYFFELKRNQTNSN